MRMLKNNPLVGDDEIRIGGGNRLATDAGQPGIVLKTGHKEGARLVDLVPPVVVAIRFVKHIARPSLQW